MNKPTRRQKLPNLKEKKKQKIWDKWKINCNIDSSPTIVLITLNINDTNIPIKRQVPNYTTKQDLPYTLLTRNPLQIQSHRQFTGKSLGGGPRWSGCTDNKVEVAVCKITHWISCKGSGVEGLVRKVLSQWLMV